MDIRGQKCKFEYIQGVMSGIEARYKMIDDLIEESKKTKSQYVQDLMKAEAISLELQNYVSYKLICDSISEMLPEKDK